MSRAEPTDLLADVGGTNARFALAHGADYGPVHRYAVADFPDFVSAIRRFLRDSAPAEPPRRAVLAFAGPVSDGRARLTNSGWDISADALKGELGLDAVILLNDFEALGWALPELQASDLLAIGGGKARAGGPMAVFGPGTGLGVAACIPSGQQGAVIATEGGHVTLAAADGREAAIIDHLRDRHGHVSAERLLSGTGLETLYRAVCAVDGFNGPDRAAAGITEHALIGDCPASIATLGTFCALLGGFAGNLALTLGASGGVFVAGGIVPRFADFLAASEFRERFEAKGRLRSWLRALPVFVVTRPDPAFPGLIAALAARCGDPLQAG